MSANLQHLKAYLRQSLDSGSGSNYHQNSGPKSSPSYTPPNSAPSQPSTRLGGTSCKVSKYGEASLPKRGYWFNPIVQEKSQEICEDCFGKFALQEVERVLPIGIDIDKFGTMNRNRNSNNDGDGEDKDNNSNSAPGTAPVLPDLMIQM
ncbi:hypothetical protein KI688_005509 [Linnemannia hyalina]|uniref:Uncharacterized protein n=1 Tax=Linnemannia hyalina TaxID=64524 RepID=A0A9P7Y2Y2_9FUNG|nr:hypothetical protein KI688_005509 [Linnemannia hyalina]